MNNQRSSNPIEPIKITKCRQICVTTYKRSSSHGKKDIKDETLTIQQATYYVKAWLPNHPTYYVKAWLPIM
jgi:hypothetical protein